MSAESPARLVGQVAAVTGASGAIGGAVATALAARGAAVCLIGRRRPALEGLARRIDQAGGVALACESDLADEEQLAGIRPRIERRFGRLDVLVHGAGVIALGPLDSAPVDDLDRQYRVNVRAPYVLTQALLPLLRATRGQVVFVNSTAGDQARAGTGQYAASKHALRGLADALRAEVNADGIRVLTLLLGRTASAMQAAVAAGEGRDYRPEALIQPADVAAIVVASLTLPRTAEVTEIRMRPLQPPA
jgi:NADP-dependent 3-hydroxy acid dehydrogenase YdfG